MNILILAVAGSYLAIGLATKTGLDVWADGRPGDDMPPTVAIGFTLLWLPLAIGFGAARIIVSGLD